MNKCLLITRPNHDITTNYLYFWSEKIIGEANSRTVKIIDLKGKRANRKEFTGVIEKVLPSLVVFNGHGDDAVISGFDNEIIIQAGDNESLLHEKITYAVSCSSAMILGQKCVGSKKTAYIGYNDDFAFIIDETKITRPLQDKTAQLFLEPSNQVAISLLKGNNAGESHKKSQKVFRQNIRRLLTSESSLENKEALPYLLWDMNHQVCLGDENAYL